MMITRRRQAYQVPGMLGVLHAAGPAGVALRPGRWVILSEWEQGLLFRYGQLVTTLAPGRHRRWGAGFTLRAVDMRPWILTLPTQEVPTADGATVKVTVAGQAKVTDPVAYVTAAQDARQGLPRDPGRPAGGVRQHAARCPAGRPSGTRLAAGRGSARG